MLSDEEVERYKRQITLRGFSREAQEKLKGGVALVAGIGGLGGTAAIYLAAAGIGKLILIHNGELTFSNLNRQILMSTDRVGQSRVEKARETLIALNPNVEVEVYDHAVTAELLDKTLPGCDVMLDCRHNFEERRILNDASIRHNIPMVEAAMDDMQAQLFTVFPGESACLHCVYPENQSWDPFGFSVLGAHSGALGCMTAIEAIKIITGFASPMKGEILYFDLGEMEFRKYKINKKENCPVCGREQG